ncbi:MAG: glycoside hydrolase family 99-like domain-containing protein [Candidatus Brockarchaeota archaeon]|nr:glycoside hydrolase family 99-like domain-containing protein [Candidatus Brockarchaeota archaeon]
MPAIRGAAAGIFLLLLLQPVARPRAETVSVVPLSFVVSTTSDWTKVTFYGLELLAWSCDLIAGEKAPQLAYSVTFDAVWIGKKQYDESNVTIRIEAVVELEGKGAALLVEKGALGDTALKIVCEGRELARIRSAGSVPGDEAKNARFFDLAYAFANVSAREVVLGRRLEKPMVLAFYYPWYGNSEGKLFHWEGVGHLEIGSSTFYPLFGPYDSRDERLIEAHVKLAKAAGLDGFVCSWWGEGTFEDAALRKVLEVSNREGFKITIYYESVREVSQDQVIDELAYVLENYSTEPSFLKIEGKPVLFIYAVSALGRSPGFWETVVGRVENISGTDALFLADTFDASYAEPFDGMHTYNPIWINEAELASAYRREAKVARVLGKLWAATVVPGYDDRKVRSPGTFVGRRGGEYYNSTWEGSVSSDPDFVLVCTWNEWHEGTNVEPSREFGFDYLKSTSSWARAFKGAELSSEGEPALSQSLRDSDGSVVLELRNEGGGDAFAVNVVVNSNASPRFANASYLPVNGSCISLYFPLVRTNESLSASIFFGAAGNLAINSEASYYSISGKRYLSTCAKSLSLAEGKAPERFAPELAILVLPPAILALLLLVRLRAKRSRTVTGSRGAH